MKLQASLDEEWIFFAEIHKTAGYPVGSGAVVHVSAAKHIKQLKIVCPPDLDELSWISAVKGRLLVLEMERPGVQGRTWFVGINQHVASAANSTAREMVLSTIAHLTIEAKRQGVLLIVIGDANAAPGGCRWGYSKKSKTLAADKETDEKFSRMDLREIASQRKQATWKACLLPKKATLDSAWIHPTD